MKQVLILIILFVGACERSCFENHDVEVYTIPINKSKFNVSFLTVVPILYNQDYDNQKLPKKNYISNEKLDSVYNLDIESNDLILKWRSLFDHYLLDTVSIYFFDIDTIQKYGWDKVRTDYKILARYDLTMENIIDMEGIVPYPLQDSTVKIYYPEGLNPFED